jgi:hypothetical protein
MQPGPGAGPSLRAIGAAQEISQGLLAFNTGVKCGVRVMAAQQWRAALIPLLLAAVVVLTLVLKLLALPLNYLGVVVLDTHALVNTAALIVLVSARLAFPPRFSLFRDVLSLQNTEWAQVFDRLPQQEWFMRGATRVVGAMAVVAIMVFALVLSSPLLVPALAILVALTWPVLLVCSIVGVASCVLLGGIGYVYVLLEPFVRLLIYDPIFATLVFAVLTLWGSADLTLGRCIQEASVLYTSSLLFTSHLLGNWHARDPHQDWQAFQSRHCWRMFGFGLPLYVALHVHPLAALCGLQLAQGASASLLLNCFENEDAEYLHLLRDTAEAHSLSNSDSRNPQVNAFAVKSATANN